MLLSGFEGVCELGEMLCAIGMKAVESASTDHGLKHSAIGLSGINSAAKILQIPEGAIFFSFIQNFTDCALTHAFDGAQAILNALV